MAVVKPPLPYEYIKGRDYDFGVRRLLRTEQYDLLVPAIAQGGPVAEFEEYLDRFKENGVITADTRDALRKQPIHGFCYRQRCRLQPIPVPAAATRKQGSHWCTQCLADEICNARYNQLGPIVMVQFGNLTAMLGAKVQTAEHVRFDNGICRFINGAQQFPASKYAFEWFDPADPMYYDNFVKYILRVPAMPLGHWGMVEGRMLMHMGGQYVCAAKAINHPCRGETDNTDLRSLSTPAFMPRWNEIGGDNYGIRILPYCVTCKGRYTVHNDRQSRSRRNTQNTDNSNTGMSGSISSSNSIVADNGADQQIAELRQEVASLKSSMDSIQSTLTNLVAALSQQR